MLLRADQENGSIIIAGKSFDIKAHLVDIPDDLAKQVILKGKYTIAAKYSELNKNCRSMLLIRGSGLGDVMFCHPLRRHILKLYPDLKIDFLTSGEYVDIIRNDPTINRALFNIDKKDYDYICNLNNVEFGTSFNLLHSFNMLHKIDLFSNIMGLSNVEDKTLFYSLTEEDDRFGQQYTNHKCIAIILRSTCDSKHLDPTPLSQLLHILSNIGYELILLDKHNDYAEHVKNLSKGLNDIKNYSGKFTLGQYAGIMKNCRGVFTPDTGFFHLASALKCKIVIYFGSIGSHITVTPGDIEKIEPKVPCYPCNRFGCPVGHKDCLKYNFEEVASVIVKKFGPP